MSTQLLPPHRVAASAMNGISARSCRALKSRGSRTSRRMVISDAITGSLRIRKPLQNQLILLTQQPTTHTRFPCLQGGRAGVRGCADRGDCVFAFLGGERCPLFATSRVRQDAQALTSYSTMMIASGWIDRERPRYRRPQLRRMVQTDRPTAPRDECSPR
jgi:hypothetical protein